MTTVHRLPSVPVKHADFAHYVNSHPDRSIEELIRPYNEFDAVLRKIYAQAPTHPVVGDNYLNIVPVYSSAGVADVKVRARDLASEPEDLKSKYLMPLTSAQRRPHGSPAVVPSLREFQTNFNLFSEGSLLDMDWSNVIAAGSAVVTSLLPVPDKYRNSKRELRKWYREKAAPASDVDLFLYGLTEEQAIEKIKLIEDKVTNATLHKTSTIRTKNTITIVSNYPTRHVQIVLRIYKSIAEILTGFDVDCACAAYDGRQVYLAPRALAAYITQVNQVDLTRRSPSYEARLSKYSHRGFEVFWSQLDRTRIDPTIFERSFGGTVGLARLLVLEKLPKASEREQYLQQRRAERGRPAADLHRRRAKKMRTNFKDNWEDEVPEWLEEDQISDYHTFTIPYGPGIHAQKIEKLLFGKDLLLNAEWNRPDDREVNLHRHPAFFGRAEDVIHDCCGSCPEPVSPEEKKVAEEESKRYVSGEISFIKDDPGRQEIGSFNPITETDWTEMAYVGDTVRLCQAIVDQNLDEVRKWLSTDGVDPNRRDYTGRTPLHLACMASSPSIVQCLVDHGARLISRLADGRTALHLAAARGDRETVRILLTKSEQNEAEEAAKTEQCKNEEVIDMDIEHEQGGADDEADNGDDDDDDEEQEDEDEDSDSDEKSRVTGSFVKIEKDNVIAIDGVPDDANAQEPDIYNVNAVAWDTNASPLHLAILNGHVAVVDELVSSFGADVLLPVKLTAQNTWGNPLTILSLALALPLPLEQAKSMVANLVQLGASPAQADMAGLTALEFIAASPHEELIGVLAEHDRSGMKRAIEHLHGASEYTCIAVQSALTTAILAKRSRAAEMLLENGAKPAFEFEDFLHIARLGDDHFRYSTVEQNRTKYHEYGVQPVIIAAYTEQPQVVGKLLACGVDPNTLTPDGRRVLEAEHIRNRTKGATLLDCVQAQLKRLREYRGEPATGFHSNLTKPDENDYLPGAKPGSYQMWAAQEALDQAKSAFEQSRSRNSAQSESSWKKLGLARKQDAINKLIRDFEILESDLLHRGGKCFKELHPDVEDPPAQSTAMYQAPIFKTNFSLTFKVPDLTDATREGYIYLYEAAWSGDVNTIERLTLARWGPEQQHRPLKIEIRDMYDFSPFAIAILRGHYDVAKAILAIAETQYKPKEEKKTKKKYTLRTTSSDGYGSDGDDDNDDDSEISLESEVVHDQFTIENIGEAAAEVESDVSPLEMLSWSCAAHRLVKIDQSDDLRLESLIQSAIYQDDIVLLRLLLDLGQKIKTSHAKEDESTIYTIPDADFQFALRLGRTHCLSELISRTGAGLPLDELIQKHGLQPPTKPKYYQGLSVYGQKRADWVAVHRVTHNHGVQGSQHHPLLFAAYSGCRESVEWLLSSMPVRSYVAYAQAHKGDKRVKCLARAELGVAGTIEQWLHQHDKLALHCAVLGSESDASEDLVRYLATHLPDCMEVTSDGGYTPLALAYSCQRTKFAKILIDAGANQAVRDRRGNNLIHLVLCGLDHIPRYKADKIRALLGMLDPRLVPSMLVERSSDHPGSLTPLARWLHRLNPYRGLGSVMSYSRNVHEADCKLDVLRTLLDVADSVGPGQKHLDLLNGAGNTVLHDMVKLGLPQMLKIIVDRRPDLLQRENATGSAPAELAENLWLSCVTSTKPQLPDSYFQGWERETRRHTVLTKSPESFAPDYESPLNEYGVRQLIHNFFRERDGMLATAQSPSMPRRLVSLSEANEVAKRLAATQRELQREDGNGEVDISEKPGTTDDGDRDVLKGFYDLTNNPHWNLRV